MRRVVVGGLAFLASASLSLLAAIGAGPEGAVRAVGAWLAVVAAAALYRRVAREALRGAASLGLALLGVVASTWTVRTALLTAFPPAVPPSPASLAMPHSVPTPGSGAVGLLAAFGGGLGVALLAWAVWRAGLVPRPVAVLSGAVALAAVAAPDPGWPYVGGGALLGTALLITGGRDRALRAQPPQPCRRRAEESGRAERIRTGPTVHTVPPPRPI